MDPINTLDLTTNSLILWSAGTFSFHILMLANHVIDLSVPFKFFNLFFPPLLLEKLMLQFISMDFPTARDLSVLFYGAVIQLTFLQLRDFVFDVSRMQQDYLLWVLCNYSNQLFTFLSLDKQLMLRRVSLVRLHLVAWLFREKIGLPHY